MNQKDKTPHEPKVQRHEEAKEKCRIYQRSLSGKNRNFNFQSAEAPLPGQFAVQRPDFRLTTNIKTIMKDNKPQTAANFLSRSSSKRLSIAGRQTSKVQRMDRIEGKKQQSIEQEKKEVRYVKEEKKEELKKNSYLIKTRVPVSKFASGHRAIKLESQTRLRLTTPVREQIKSKDNEGGGENQTDQTKFLPVQYYLMDDETPEKLMKAFKIGESDYVLGYSRWYDLEGNNSWKKCRVLSYCERTGRWDIEWLHNQKTKQVSRANLYFEGESRVQFENRLSMAYQIRKNSEVYYKYNILIDQMESKPRQMSLRKLKSIMTRTGHPKSCEKFEQEVKQLYKRSNQQAQFNSLLPYDEEKIKEFKNFLPKYLFKPQKQHMMRYKQVDPPRISVTSNAYFTAAAETFKGKTSLTHRSRLTILSCVNELEIEAESFRIISWNSEQITNLNNLSKYSLIKANQFSKNVEKSIFYIENCIGNQLDQLYVEKRTRLEEFEKQTKQYQGFLYLIIIRLEELIRKAAITSFHQLLHILSPVQANTPEELISASKDQTRCQLELKLLVKDSKIQCEPSIKDIDSKLWNILENVLRQLSDLPCPTKSYLKTFRKSGFLQIEGQPFSLNGERQAFQQSLSYNIKCLEQFLYKFAKATGEMLSVGSQIKSKIQKKYNYSEIGDFVLKMKNFENTLVDIISPYLYENNSTFKIGLFIIRSEDVLNRARRKNLEGFRELYRFVLEKIMKENQKIQKSILQVEEKLDIQPKNIIEMLQLQKMVREQAGEELDKVQSKLKEMPEKIGLLQSIQSIEYRDFELLNHVYVFPLRLKQKLKMVKKDIQGTYRKQFGEELNRDAGKVLQVTRECNEQMLSCFKVQNLEDMCDRFMQFSNLNEKIKGGLKEAHIINEREQAMSWSRTDFGRLTTLSNDFSPYYILITLAKNFQVHLEILAAGSFSKIDSVALQKQLEQSKQEFGNIKKLFNMNTRMLRISMEVQQQYLTFTEHLPLIKALRNPDLRERHWMSIRDIIAINPQSDEVSLKRMINAGVETKILQLQEISAIATRELVYERRLIRLKREWKEVRFHFGENDGVLSVSNLKELCARVQADIFQIQEMLGASFIKFLEGEILGWRNQVLYRSYELLEKWEKLQNQVLLLSAIFSKPRACTQLPRQYFQFQLLQKSWKGLYNLIEVQPTISDILQSRAMESLTALQSTSERIRKQLYAFFQDKKREYARLACISDDQFVNLLSYDDSDPGENPIFEQTVRKCFQNIKSLIRNERKQIVKIKTCAGEQLHLKETNSIEKIVEYVLPNEVIIQLQNQIQKQLRDCLEMFDSNPQQQIMQVLLLYQRLNFTSKVQEQMHRHQAISPEFIREIEVYRDQLIAALPNRLTPKNYTQLLQCLYHLQLTNTLYRSEFIDVFSFYWLSQPRTYLKNDDYLLEIGLLSESYGFQIVDLDGIIIEQWSARVFCSIAGAIKDRGMCMISGNFATGKISVICKLAALFGRKEHILEGGFLTSYRNLIDIVRMAASGLWVVLRHIQNLQMRQLQILSRNLENLWTSFLTHPIQIVMIENAGINIKTSHLKIFATTILQGNQVSPNLRRQFQSTFRCIFLPKVNLQFIVGAKLLLLGVEDISPLRVCIIVEHILKKFGHLSLQLSINSEILFIIKLFSLISGKRSKILGQELFEVGLAETLRDLIKDEILFGKIQEELSNSFNIKIKFRKQDSDTYKSLFSSQKYYYNQHLLNTFTELKESLNYKNTIIIVGPRDTGKSALTRLLKETGSIKLESICPNAYFLAELYGKDDLNGIICSLLEKILKIIKKEEDHHCLYGLFLDGELGVWADPLAKMINTGHIIQPNGNRLLIQENVKLIFQCLSLENAGPSLLMEARILHLHQPLKWQNIFNWYLNTQFYGNYGKEFYLKYFQLLIPYIVDPMMQFYDSTKKEYKNLQINTFIPTNSLILSLLRLYESLLRYQFLDEKITQFNQKISSDSFNLFIMALVWTFGVSLPDDARKSFQRHFKYLIKRAVQVHMSAVAKETLPEDDQDLFNTCYYQGRWEEWKRPEIYLHAPSITLNRPSDIGLSFIIERTLEHGQGVLLLGPNDGFKTLFMSEFSKSINPEAYKILKIAFQPNSTTETIKQLIVKEMNKERYSFNFSGFAHGKKTIIMIRDISLPMQKQASTKSSNSITEFIRHYYTTNGWYIFDTEKHYVFKNLIFCGTMNYHHPLPVSLTKYMGIVNRPLLKQDLSTIVKEIVQDVSAFTPYIGNMIVDLHFSIEKEFKSVELVPISISQALSVAKGFALMGEASKHELIRYWIFLTEKIYQQRLSDSQMQRLFYLINNVLMQKEKIRYKSIKPNPESFGTYFTSDHPIFHNLTTFRKEISKRWRSLMEEEDRKVEEDTSEKTQFLVGFDKCKTKKKVKNISEVTFKDTQLKLVSYVCSTFEMQTPLILSFSISDGSETPTLDLQEALEISAVLRGARLMPAQLGEQNESIWKSMILSLVGDMLDMMQSDGQTKQTIVFLYDLKSSNDFIIDDLMTIKRNKEFPYFDEVQVLLRGFLDNRSKNGQDKMEQSQEHQLQTYRLDSKPKGRERRFENIRREKEKDLKYLSDRLLDKMKFVVNIKAQSLKQIRKHNIFKYYEDMLGEFSIINVIQYSKMSTKEENKEKFISAHELAVSGDNPIITDIDPNEELEGDSRKKFHLLRKNSNIFLSEREESFIQSLSASMMNDFCLFKDSEWLRGKNNNFKYLYQRIKERLCGICNEKAEKINKLKAGIATLQEMRETLERSFTILTETYSQVMRELKLANVQKVQREFQYQRCIHQNQNIERSIIDLQKERVQLNINYQRMTEKHYKEFCHEKLALMDCLKQAKEKKMGTINNELKMLLEALAILLQKKIKKDEEYFRQILKDINSPTGNSKVVKKVSNLIATNMYSLGQKTTSKIRDVLKEIDFQKLERRQHNEQREVSFTDKLNKSLKQFFRGLLQFYSCVQQKELKECLKRLHDNQKYSEKLKDNLSRNLKGPQYTSILENYQQVRQKIITLQEEFKLVATKKEQVQHIVQTLQKCFSLSHPNDQEFRCGHCGHKKCIFVCQIQAHLDQQEETVTSIIDRLSSFSFTLAIIVFFRFQNKGKDMLKTIEATLANYHKKYNRPAEIQFLLDDIPKLASLHLAPQNKAFDEESIDKLAEVAKKQAENSMILCKQFQENSVIALAQFIPGNLVIGVQNGSVGAGDISFWKSNGGAMGVLTELFDDFLVNSSQLLDWVRRNGSGSRKKFAVSSRVLISNKNLSKSAISLANQYPGEEASPKNTCLVIITDKQEYKNCLKILKREMSTSQLTIVLAAEKSILGFQQHIYTFYLKNQDLNLLEKKIEGILFVDNERGETQSEFLLNQSHKNKQNSIYTICHLLESLESSKVVHLVDQIELEASSFDKNTKCVVKIEVQEDKNDLVFGILKCWVRNFVDNCQAWLSSLGKVEGMIKITNEKAKIYQNNQKISRSLRLLCETIIFLQSKGWLNHTLSVFKYLQIIREIFQRNQNIKRSTVGIKQPQEFKMLLWNSLACLYPGKEFILFFIFFFLYESDLDAFHLEVIPETFHQCLLSYEKSLGYLRGIKVPGKLDLTALFFTGIEENKIQISKVLRKKVQLFENCLMEKHLLVSVQNNGKEWYKFLKSLGNETVAIPPELLENNKFVIFFFFCLFKPGEVRDWVKRLDSDNLLFQNEDYHLHLYNNVKSQFYGVSEISFQAEWAHLPDRLYYLYHNIGVKQVYLVNYKPQEIISLCQSNRIGHLVFDLTTFFYRIDKCYKNRTEGLSNLDNMEEAKEKIMKEEQKIIEDMKSVIKNQNWIIVNLNHFKIMNISLNELYSKFQYLFDTILHPEKLKTHRYSSEKHQETSISHIADLILRNSNKHVEMNHYKYMFLFLLDSDEGTSIQSQKGIHQKWLQSQNSCIIEKEQNRFSRQLELEHFIDNLVYEYYISLNKFKKAKKEYEKLTFIQKKIIFEFVFICHKILHIILSNKDKALADVNTDYLGELLTNIYRSISIIKSSYGSKFTQEEEESVKKYQSKLNTQSFPSQKDTFRLNAVLRVEEYTSLLLEYVFDIDYKTKVKERRMHLTFDFIGAIRAEIDQLANYDVEAVLIYLKAEDKAFNFVNQQLVTSQTSDELENISLNFNPENYEPCSLSAVKESLISQQQQKLIKMLLADIKIDFSSKKLQIEELFQKERLKMGQIIQILNLFDLQSLQTCYKEGITKIQFALQEKHGSELTKLSKEQKTNLNMLVLNALTQLLDTQNIPRYRQNSKMQLNGLHEGIVTSLLTLYKKMRAFIVFIDQFKMIIRQFQAIDPAAEGEPNLQGSDSSDEEENIRKKQLAQLKKMIKGRVNIKFTVSNLNQRLCQIFSKMSGSCSRQSKELTSKQLNQIFSSLSSMAYAISDIQRQTEESTLNYNYLEDYQKQIITNIEQSNYSAYNSTSFVFRFQLYRFFDIIELSKLIHSKKHHLQIDRLSASFNIAAARRVQSKESLETYLYFKGFYLVNGKYRLFNNKIILEESLGEKNNCENLYIEVVIKEQKDLVSEERESVDGSIVYSFPFYMVEKEKGLEHKERVSLKIYEFAEEELLKANIYLTNQ